MSPYNRGYRATRSREQQGHELADLAIQAEEITHQQEELPLAAAPQVPITKESAETLGKPFQPVADKFASAIADLGKRPLTRQTVEIAKEYDVEAIKYLKDLEGSDLRRHTDAIFQAHRFFTGIIAKLKAPADNLRRTCSDVIGRFDRAERQRLAEEQRVHEEAIRKQQEAERAAELAALEASGATEEAEVLKEAPLAPVVAPPAKEATKIEGISVVYSAGWGKITDPVAFTKWLSEHPDEMAGFEPKMAYWKAKATAHFEKTTGAMSLTIPGLEWSITNSTRHRTAGE